MTKKAQAILEKLAISPEYIALKAGGYFNRKSKAIDRLLAMRSPRVRRLAEHIEDNLLGRIQDFEDNYITGTSREKRYQHTLRQMIADPRKDIWPPFHNN